MSLELRIQITKENRDSIFRIIDEILDNELQNAGISLEESTIGVLDRRTCEQESNPVKDLMFPPPSIPNLPDPGPNLSMSSERERMVGSWGHFNSFYPIIAACRVAGNLTALDRKEELRLDKFVDQSVLCFDRRNLKNLRGFPTSRKDSARGRYVWHFIVTASEMGLLRLISNNGSAWKTPYTLKGWEQFEVGPTLKGLRLAQMPNDVFDKRSGLQVLSSEESAWIADYLESIDTLGYKEYSMLREVHRFLRDRNVSREDLKNWFMKNNTFHSYVETWSRKLKPGKDEEGMRQLSNMANLFAASKIALLRELRVVTPTRNSYVTIGQLGENRGADNT